MRDRIVRYWIPGILTSLLCVMAWFKTASMHASYYDLGVFEHALWDMAFNGDWRWLFYGHAQFLLPFDVLLYKLVPTSYMLVIKQALIVGGSCWLVARLVEGRYRLWATTAYALFFPIWFLALFDFHPDHMVIPLGLAFYLAAHKGRMGLATVCALGIALVKEPFAAAGVFYGLYLVIRFRAVKWGSLCVIACSLVFFVGKAILIPAFTYDVSGSVYRTAYSWMGQSLSAIVVYILAHPLDILVEVVTPPEKILFLVCGFAGLAFLPLLSPLELIPALPVLAFSLLSRTDNYYGLAHHYTAGLVAPYMVAFCFALPRVKRFVEKKNISLRIIGGLAAGCILLTHVVFSPSPLSRYFWTDKVWGYGWSAYFVSGRDAMIREALVDYIPPGVDASVSTGNTLVTSSLAQRTIFEVFPRGVTQPIQIPDMDNGGAYPGRVDFVVLDLRRPWYLVGEGCRWRTSAPRSAKLETSWEQCAPLVFQEEFLDNLNAMYENYTTIFEEDGFIIAKRTQALN